MPLLEFYEPTVHPFNQYLLDNCESIRKYYDENYMDGFEPDELVNEAMDHYLDSTPFSDEKLSLIINWTHYIFSKTKRTKKPQVQKVSDDKRLFHHVIFSSDPSKSEEQNIKDIDRYRNAHFKNYKHCWVSEKFSADSERYHVHCLIECPMKVVHRKQNLKPASYYKGAVMVNKGSGGKPFPQKDIGNLLVYFEKENEVKGDLEYFKNI